jgi:hypothetical protein
MKIVAGPTVFHHINGQICVQFASRRVQISTILERASKPQWKKEVKKQTRINCKRGRRSKMKFLIEELPVSYITEEEQYYP